jgi:hypothetical protein
MEMGFQGLVNQELKTKIPSNDQLLTITPNSLTAQQNKTPPQHHKTQITLMFMAKTEKKIFKYRIF